MTRARKPSSRRLELLEMLQDYTPTRQEQRSLDEMKVLVRESHDVLSAHSFAPGHFTVSGFVTDPSLTRLLLIHHRRVGAWLQPGGHVEPEDESLRDTLRREVAEETGMIDLSPGFPELFDVEVHKVGPSGGNPAHLHFDLRFHVTTVQRQISDSDEVHDAAWVALSEVAQWTQDASVSRAVAKLQQAR